MFDDDEEPEALGTVLTDERGSLPFLLVHGESLVASAAWALGAAGVMIVDDAVPWSGLVDAAETFVLHDSLCPLTPPDFIAACVQRCRDTGAVVVATRPVTDTVKEVTGGFVGATVDRDTLRTVCSPVVLPGVVVAALPSLPSLDLTELVVLLRASYDVVEVEAPPGAARVSGPDDVRLLEGLRQD